MQFLSFIGESAIEYLHQAGFEKFQQQHIVLDYAPKEKDALIGVAHDVYSVTKIAYCHHKEL